MVLGHVVAATLSAAAQGRPPLPAPSGPHGVGTATYEWIDHGRPEVVDYARRDRDGALRSVPPTGSRQLVVRLWYPSPADSRGGEPFPYNPSAIAFRGVLRDTARLSAYRTTAAHAAEGRPLLADARLPLLIFSPATGMFVEDYTTLLADLASHGFVVAAIAHPGITLLTFGDGALGMEWGGWRPPRTLSTSLKLDSLRAAFAFSSARDAYLAADVHFVVRQLLADGVAPFSALIDSTRVGVFGHAMGGAVAALAASDDDRKPIRALAVFDAILPGALFERAIPVPLLLVRTTATTYPAGWSDRLGETFAHVTADGYDLLIHGATPLGFSDRMLLASRTTDAADQAVLQLRLVTEYTRAFFTRVLKDESEPLLDTGATPPAMVTLTRHPAPKP